jgi:hypothetical protein
MKSKRSSKISGHEEIKIDEASSSMTSDSGTESDFVEIIGNFKPKRQHRKSLLEFQGTLHPSLAVPKNNKRLSCSENQSLFNSPKVQNRKRQRTIVRLKSNI